MKRLFITVGRGCYPIIGGLALALATPVAAQTAPGIPRISNNQSGQIAAALAYPNGSQRFFEAGKAQFEQQIQQLLQDDENPETFLTIQPEVLEQQVPAEQTDDLRP